MAKKIQEVIEPEYLFCSATMRPDCFHTNLCCLHCSDVVKCTTITTTKIKPCTIKNCTIDEKCEFAL